MEANTEVSDRSAKTTSIMRAPQPMTERSVYSNLRRYIPTGVAILLFVAALLKVVFPARSLSITFSQPWLILTLVGLEVVLAMWLFCGLWPGAARITALALFSDFAVFTLTQATAGAESCACFGSLRLSPWLTLILDASVLIVLFLWSPEPVAFRGARRLALVSLVAPLTIVAAAWAWRDSPLLLPDLVVSPQKLNLGTIVRGKATTATINLHNGSDQPVNIVSLKTSCPCLQILLPQTVIATGQEIQGEVRLDMSAEPEFVGKLAMQVQGATTLENVAFRLAVEAQIVR